MKVHTLLGSAAALVLTSVFCATPVAARECPWCTVQFTGIEITGHGCSSASGVYQIETCVATVEGCVGEYCLPEETENLVDLTPIAILRECADGRHVTGLWRVVTNLAHDAPAVAAKARIVPVAPQIRAVVPTSGNVGS